jgi:hypothetical protein
MKLATLALALLAPFALPAQAGTQFLVDFERTWDYGQTVDASYAASGVVFTNMLGLSNDPAFAPYYSNSPSPLGVGFVQLDGVSNTTAYMNVAEGVSGVLDFFYASPTAITGAIKAYSGLNGTGELLGVFDLAANTGAEYDSWTAASFAFAGKALSFDLSGAANVVAFDNFSALPEPGEVSLVLAALGGLAIARRRRS